MSIDKKFMQRCLELAVLGAGTVSPNPMVGAVVVHEDRIIGEGYTSPFGGPHAEVNAVRAVKEAYGEEESKRLLSLSTVYVSLEPCAHFGKTPPCAEMLVANKVKKVVVGCKDPFSKVNGQGIAKLANAGIEVIENILEQECLLINRRFFTQINQHRPYIILKWAETEDGYFAPSQKIQSWISNKASKQLSHKWRSEEDAILVGTATAIIDNPNLDNRLWTGKSPKRVLIDRNLSVPVTNNIFSNKKTDLLIFNQKKSQWLDHIKYIELENFDLYLPQNIMYQLYLMDIQSIIIEGGVKTLDMFIQAGLWDEARVFVGNCKWGEGVEAPKLDLLPSEEKKVTSNKLKLYYNKK